MNPVLLLLNGELDSDAAVRRISKSASMVLAANGGVKHCVRLKIRPRVVIGDMDSLPKPLPRWKDVVYLCDFDEDRSDFEKALDFLKENGAGPVWIAGALGKRLDHTLVNLSLFERYSKKLPLILLDSNAQIAGPGRYAIRCAKGNIFSLLPVSAAARVTTRGLKYSLKNSTLRRGSRGLSNRAVSTRIEVHVLSGRLWILHS